MYVMYAMQIVVHTVHTYPSSPVNEMNSFAFCKSFLLIAITLENASWRNRSRLTLILHSTASIQTALCVSYTAQWHRATVIHGSLTPGHCHTRLSDTGPLSYTAQWHRATVIHGSLIPGHCHTRLSDTRPLSYTAQWHRATVIHGSVTRGHCMGSSSLPLGVCSAIRRHQPAQRTVSRPGRLLCSLWGCRLSDRIGQCIGWRRKTETLTIASQITATRHSCPQLCQMLTDWQNTLSVVLSSKSATVFITDLTAVH